MHPPRSQPQPAARSARGARRLAAALTGLAALLGLAAPAGPAGAQQALGEGVRAMAPPAPGSGAPAAGTAAPWAAGVSGAGRVVAVVDTGVRHTHQALAGRVLAGLDAIHGGPGTHDAQGHGTHVAGVLAGAARGAGGAAPGLRVLPVRVAAHGGATHAVLSAGVAWAAARTPLLNLSLTATAPIAQAALHEALAGGALVVAAAGNRGAAHPDWPARFAREAWANGPQAAGALLAVGAVDAQGRIAPFSNRAGDAARWYLVAPGVDVVSAWADADDAQAMHSGTSMAAPAVSGAAALLLELWPQLTPREAAEILLASARDLGAPGTDPVYGRGLLDVAAALRPVGGLHTRGAHGAVALAGTGLRLSAATAALARPLAEGRLALQAEDAYRRGFSADPGSAVAPPPPLRVDEAFAGLDARLERVSHVLPGGPRLVLEPGTAFSLVGEDGAGGFALGAGPRVHEWFGVAAGAELPGAGNPYLGFAPDAALAARSLRLGATTLKAGVLAGAGTRHSGAAHVLAGAGTLVLEAARPVGEALRLAATASRSREEGAWLGAVGSGALAPGAPVRTDALQLGALLRLGPRTALAATAAAGRTPAVAGAGLVERIEETRGTALSLALVRHDLLVAGDGVSLAVSQPMRTRSGRAHLAALQGTDADGAPRLARQALSLVPQGRETLLELGWRAPLGPGRALSGVLAWRHQPNHDALAAPDTMVAVRYRQVF